MPVKNTWDRAFAPVQLPGADAARASQREPHAPWIYSAKQLYIRANHRYILSSRELDSLQRTLDSTISTAQALNAIIFQHITADWLFEVLDSAGNVIFTDNDWCSYLVGARLEFLSRDNEIRRALARGHAEQMEKELERCSHGPYCESLLIPLFDHQGQFSCILSYVFFEAGCLTEELSNELQTASAIIQENFLLNQACTQQSELFLEELPEGAILFNPRARILAVNQGGCDLIGKPAADIIGRPLSDFLTPERGARAPGIQNADLATLHRQAGLLPCGISVKPVWRSGPEQQFLLRFQPAKPAALQPASPADSHAFDVLIGKTPEMQKIIRMAARIAPKPSTVLIEGESGTGKEVIARAIHAASGRQGDFVSINCGALTKELLQSELFGYMDGAFTGAKKGGKIGKFEAADRGTLFLDEIGEMPLDMQVSLLRVLQERAVVPLGGHTPKPVDVRIIAATNRDLRAMMLEGAFREDLYYRLNVISFTMPPLRQRTEDIPLLCTCLLQRLCQDADTPAPTVLPEVLEIFQQYQWPGNVRELSNVLERALFMSEDGTISADLLPDHLTDLAAHKPPDLKLLENMQDFEAAAIRSALIECQGNISAAAARLNIARSTLYLKIRDYNIQVPRRNLG